MSVTTLGTIKAAGRRRFVQLDEEASYRERLGLTFQPEQRVRITVEPMTRSTEANAYLWGVVYETIVISLSDGTTADDMHEVMCQKFLPDESRRVEWFNRTTGESIEATIDPRRSSRLGGLEFYDFVEKVRAFGRDFLGVQTPDPDPTYWRKRVKRAA